MKFRYRIDSQFIIKHIFLALVLSLKFLPILLLHFSSYVMFILKIFVITILFCFLYFKIIVSTNLSKIFVSKNSKKFSWFVDLFSEYSFIVYFVNFFDLFLDQFAYFSSISLVKQLTFLYCSVVEFAPRKWFIEHQLFHRRPRKLYLHTYFNFSEIENYKFEVILLTNTNISSFHTFFNYLITLLFF